MSSAKGRIGTTFEDFLRQEGTLEATSAVAIKRVLAWQLTRAMADNALTKAQLAKAMKTSRSQLDRILDPENQAVQLDSIIKAVRAVGRELRIELV